MSSRRPLDGIDRLLIDGNNLLHRHSGGVTDGALRGLLIDLRRKLPPTVHATLVLDGHPAPGMPAYRRIDSQLDFRHAGSQSADDAMVAEVGGLHWQARGRTIVVTDDRALADRLRSAGAQTRRLDWLSALPPLRR